MEFKLEVVVIRVTDVDRAKAFYVDTCGFICDVDHSAGPDFRVVQITPPGSACSVSFGVGLGGPGAGSPGLQLVVEDVAAARAQLADGGVVVTPVRHMVDGAWVDGHGGPFNAFCFFDDLDGNSWSVQEKPSA